MTQNMWRLPAAAFSVVLLTSAYSRTSSISTMSQCATAFLNSLDSGQKSKVKFAFDSEERLFWHFIPTDMIPERYKRPRNGLTLGEMTAEQRHLAMTLLTAGLSQSGNIKAQTIMSLEQILKILEKDTPAGRRNPERYHFSVFGEPSESGTWGYRIEGHHISLHFTVDKGRLAGSPSFFGANPHEVRQGARAGLRILAREEDLARDLVRALDESQRKTAIVAAEAYPDILTEASRKAALKGQPDGLSAARMNARQRALLHDLLAEYAGNMAEPIASARLDKVKKAGTNIRFAWAGGIEKGQPHYYRVAGPTFLIEYDNTQNGANHSHTVWREYDGDFGLDLLGEHIRSSHR